MHWTQIIGIAILASPFVGVFILASFAIGFLETCGIFALTTALVATVAFGAAMAGGAFA